jgi:hypothetical protein
VSLLIRIKKSRNRGKKAVSSVIGGILIFGILFSVGFAYFSTANQDYKALVASSSQQSQEAFLITPSTVSSDNDIGIIVNNTGVISITIASIIITNITASPATEYVIATSPSSLDTSNPKLLPWISINPTLNSYSVLGNVIIDTKVRQDSGINYNIQVVSQRGTVESTTWPLPSYINPVRISGVTQGFGSFVLNFQSFKFFYDQSGTTIGDGYKVGGYYGFNIPAGESVVFQAQVTNLDPRQLSIIIGKESAISVAGGPSGTDFYIVGDLVEQTSCGMSGTCVGAYPYLSSITIPYGSSALLNFSATQPGGCVGPGSLSGVMCQNSPNAQSGITAVFLMLIGYYSNQGLYSQTIPFAASYASCGAIQSASPGLSGTGGTTVTLTLGANGGPGCGGPSGGFSVAPSLYWISSTGTVSNVTSQKVSTTSVKFVVPTHTTGYYAIFAFDGANAGFATYQVTG